MTPADARALTPLMWGHVSPYGAFDLAMEQRLDLELRSATHKCAKLRTHCYNAPISCELLGFHLASDFDLRKIGLLYYVLASSENLGDSMQRAARFSTIANEGISLRFCNEDQIAMTFTYVGVDRQSDRHQIEFWLTSLARICRQLTNRHLIPTYAKVILHREAGAAELNSFLGCDIVFGADVDEVAFPGHVRDFPVVSGDPYLNELLLKHCEDALSHRGACRGTLRSDLETEIVKLLPHGKAQMSEISCRLGMSQRTLARRLSSEGLTFAGILADLRVDLAKRHLTDEDPIVAMAPAASLFVISSRPSRPSESILARRFSHVSLVDIERIIRRSAASSAGCAARASIRCSPRLRA